MLAKERTIMVRAIHPLTSFPPIITKMACLDALKGACNFDCRINSMTRIPAKHPKKKPPKVPRPRKNGVKIREPAIAPIAEPANNSFEGRGLNESVIPIRKSIISAIIEKIRRNNMILKPIRSKPVMAAYARTSVKMRTVPGKPSKDK